MLLLGVSFACQKTTPELFESKPTSSAYQQTHLAEIFKYASFRFSDQTHAARFEGMPNFPVDGLAPMLQDALTALICHKTPREGQYQHVNIDPIFTFEVHNENNEEIVFGEDVANFIDKTIDSLLYIGSNLEFQETGQLMITLLQLEELVVGSNQIEMHLTVHYLLETEAFEEESFNYDPLSAPYDLVCDLQPVDYIPTTPAALLDFNWILNAPNCNNELRWRQRLHLDGNGANNPPQPTANPRTGFMWKLMYSGVQSAFASPQITPIFYTNYGVRNMWSRETSLPPDTIPHWIMIDYINGINHRFRDEIVYPHNANYWDPQSVMVSNGLGNLQFNPTQGPVQCYAHTARFYWSEWKWVAVPDADFWNNLPVSFETGITDWLNP